MSNLTTEYKFRDGIRRRVYDMAKEKGMTLGAVARASGITKNMLHRILHFEESPYLPVQSVDAYCALLDLFGISWGDLESKKPATMSEVLHQIDALTTLDDGQKYVMRTTLMSLYCSMRDAARGESDD